MYRQPLRVGEFLDVANLRISINEAFGPNAHINFEKLRAFTASLGSSLIAEAFCTTFGNGSGFQLFHHLREIGYRVDITPVRTLHDGSKKANVDPLLAFRLCEAIARHKLNAVVLGTGDVDFLPVVQTLTHRGIEVIVLGPTPNHTASELVFAASRFHTLAELGLVDLPARPARPAPCDSGPTGLPADPPVARNGHASALPSA